MTWVDGGEGLLVPMSRGRWRIVAAGDGTTRLTLEGADTLALSPDGRSVACRANLGDVVRVQSLVAPGDAIELRP
jgi:hypothetical protein